MTTTQMPAAAGTSPLGAKAREITYAEAIAEALRTEMRLDPRVFVMGEDVGNFGGLFGGTKDLLREFGPERVRDTPISEAALIGAGVGAAITGMAWAMGTVVFETLGDPIVVNGAGATGVTINAAYLTANLTSTGAGSGSR